MKTLIGIILITSMSLGCAASKINKGNSQPAINTKVFQDSAFKKDTLSYLRNNFIAKKNLYIGKPLNRLLKDLPYKPVSYLIGSSGVDRSISPDITISFLSRQLTGKYIMEKSYPILLIIIWETPVPLSTVFALRDKGGKTLAWQNAESVYYGKLIVKDIILGYTNR